jgi:hypothetical protein
MTSSAESPRSTRRALRFLLVIAVVAGVAAGAAHLFALWEFDRATRPGPVTSRLAAARVALVIEPWNRGFAVRVVTLRALQLFEDAEIDPAYFLLLPSTQVVSGDPFLKQVYQQVLAVKRVTDSRKSHVQHGHETSTGALPLGGYQP